MSSCSQPTAECLVVPTHHRADYWPPSCGIGITQAGVLMINASNGTTEQPPSTLKIYAAGHWKSAYYDNDFVSAKTEFGVRTIQRPDTDPWPESVQAD